MASVLYHCRVSDQSYYDLRFGPQNSNTQNQLPRLPIDRFKVEICVWHGVSSNQPRSGIFLTCIPSSRSCFVLSCHSFFKESGQALLRMKLSHPSIPREYVDGIVSNAMNYARRLLENRDRFGSNSSKEIPLALDVIVETCSDEAYERDVMEWIMENSMHEVQMIPASKKAIAELLKQVRFEGGSEENSQCSICFEDFNKGDEVSAMPCQHVYHHQCIVQWLEKSHMCPLCRHPLPTESD